MTEKGRIPNKEDIVKYIANRPTTTFEGGTIGSQLEGKAGSRRAYGQLLDQMISRTRKPRRRRKK